MIHVVNRCCKFTDDDDDDDDSGGGGNDGGNCNVAGCCRFSSWFDISSGRSRVSFTLRPNGKLIFLSRFESVNCIVVIVCI